MNVLIIEDHPLIRGALHALLKRLDPNVHVNEADRLAVLERQLNDYGQPEVVIVDLSLPDARGVTVVRDVRRLLPLARIVVVTASPESDYGDLVREAGASGYIEKSSPLSVMGEALRPFLNINKEIKNLDIKLSKRQHQILQLMSDGLSNRDIGIQLALSEHTVKVHAWRLFRRMEVKSRTEAAHVARCMGWVEAVRS